METEAIIGNLSIAEKICLLNALYTDISQKGTNGDTELAHVNKAEQAVLLAMGGSGTINPGTGLIQFGGGSPPPPPPAQTSSVQQAEFPTELKPYIADVLSRSKAIQEKREAEGFVPYTGPQIAEFTPAQERAFTGVEGMVGAGERYFAPATGLAAMSAAAPTSAEVGSYMSPYMQQVVEIQQREAQRQGDIAAQQLAAQAATAGAFGGSRFGVAQAEQQRNLQQQLGDIQARGLAAAFEDAQRRIAEQRQRELAAAGQFSMLGQVAPQQQIKELTALEAVGTQRQAQQQKALDIAKQQFEQEQTFPERTLQQYQSVIRGFPLQPTVYQTGQATVPAPTYLQQAAGLGGLALGAAGMMGAFKKRGGKINSKAGLGSIVVKRQMGGGFKPFPGSTLDNIPEEDLSKILLETYDPNKPVTLVTGEQLDKLKKKMKELPGDAESKLRELLKNISGSKVPVENVVIPEMQGLPPEKTGTTRVSIPVPPPLSADVLNKRNTNLFGGPDSSGPSSSVFTPDSKPFSIDIPSIPGMASPQDYIDQYRKQLGTATDKLTELAKIEKGLLEKQKEGMSTQRWMSVAQLGASILAQPGGQTFLQSIGKGVTDSKLIDRLSALDDKEQSLALNIARLDKQTMMEQLGLTAKQAESVLEERKVKATELASKAALMKAIQANVLDAKEYAQLAESLSKLAAEGRWGAIHEYRNVMNDPKAIALADALLSGRSPEATTRGGEFPSVTSKEDLAKKLQGR